MKDGNLPRPRILIADDEEDLLMLLEKVLSKEGYEVETLLNAENLIEQVRDHPPDILLLDIRMQGKNGGELCKELKNDYQTKDIPIILFSANDDIDEIARECGADDCLVKPLNPVLARQKFRKVMRNADKTILPEE